MANTRNRNLLRHSPATLREYKRFRRRFRRLTRTRAARLTQRFWSLWSPWSHWGPHSFMNPILESNYYVVSCWCWTRCTDPRCHLALRRNKFFDIFMAVMIAGTVMHQSDLCLYPDLSKLCRNELLCSRWFLINLSDPSALEEKFGGIGRCLGPRSESLPKVLLFWILIAQD